MDMAFLSLSAGMARLRLIGKVLVAAVRTHARLFPGSREKKVTACLKPHDQSLPRRERTKIINYEALAELSFLKGFKILQFHLRGMIPLARMETK
jgi:hypothetical protein